MSTSLIETAEGGSLQQKCAEQLAAELQKEAQLRKESEADSANKSRELWLLREKLAQQQALHQDQVSVLRASLHAAKKRQAAATHAIAASIPTAPSAAAAAVDSDSKRASSTGDTPAATDQQPKAQAGPSSLGAPTIVDSSTQQHSQQQQEEAAAEGAPQDSSPAQGPAGDLPQQASAASCLQAAQQLLVIANRLQDLVGTLSSAQPAAAAELSVMQWQLTAACNLLSAQQPAWDAVSSGAPDQSPAAGGGGEGAGATAPASTAGGRLSHQRSLLAPATCPAARLFSGAACPQPGPLCWFYLDDEDCIRGPYDAASMLRWHCQGFLEDSLPVVALLHSPAAAQGGLVAPEPQAFLPLQQLLAAVASGQQYRPLEPTWADAACHRRTPGSLRPLRKTAAAAATAGEQQSGQGTPSNTPRRRGTAAGWGDDAGGSAGTPPGRSKAWLVASRLHSSRPTQQQQQQAPSSPTAAADEGGSKDSQEDVVAVDASSGSGVQEEAAVALAEGTAVPATGVPADGPAAEGMSLGYSWLSAPQVALSHPLAAMQQVANMIMEAVQLDTPRTSPEPSPSPRGGSSPQHLPRSTHSAVVTSSPDSCERPHALLVDRSASRSHSPDPQQRRLHSQARTPQSMAASGQVARPWQRRETSAEVRGMARGFAASAGHAGDVMTWAASSPDSPPRGGSSSAARRGRQLQRGSTSQQRDGSDNSGAGWGTTSSLIQLAGLAAPAAGGLGQLLSSSGLADTLHQALRSLSPERSPTKSVVMSLS